MAKAKAVGIDLGTTYSAMAWLNESGQSVLIPNEEGDLNTPSVVLFEDDATIVGKEAKKVSVLKADRVASCVKRDMGKPYYSRPIKGRYLPPEVIQSYILKKLKTDITRAIGPDFRTIITVPAYFDEPRRKATYDAGEMAGLRVLDIVNEPTAAALAFGADMGYLTRFGAPRERMNVLVYDLGGGTFDATLIDMQAGNLRTVCTDGDVQLGGHDWDLRLVNYFAEVFEKEHREDPRKTPAGFQRLLADAEETKHTLSARQQARVRIQYNGKTTVLDVARAEFEQRTGDLLERTRFTTKNLLSTAGMEWKDIGRVLLTGGSTRMPMVVKMLKELTGKEPDLSVNPDEAVARGAAIYCNYLLAAKGESGHQANFDVTNVNAHSLGVEGTEAQTLRPINTVLIPRNSTLPAKKTELCMTKVENQKTVVVQVLEGESRNPQECTPIGRTVIRDLPQNLPQGWPVELTYEYGVNGRLAVRAVVKGTDREVRLELERDQSMSADRLNQWRRTVAAPGGMDAFDLAIQREIEDLTKQATGGPAGAVPSGSGLIVGGPPRGQLQPGMPQHSPMQPGPMQPGQMPQPGASGIGLGSLPRPGAYPGGAPLSATGMPGASGIGLAGPPGSLPQMATGVRPGQSGIGLMNPPPPFPGAGASGIGLGQPQAGQAQMGPGMRPAGSSGVLGAGPMMGGPGGSGPHSPPGMPSLPQPAGVSGVGMRPGQPQPGQPQPNQSGLQGKPAVAGQPGAPGQPGQPAPRRSTSASGTDLILYVFLITLGIMVGYYVLVAMAPGANFLRLNLPGLKPVSAPEATPSGATPSGTATSAPPSTPGPASEDRPAG